MTNKFPWYDSLWLTQYIAAKEVVKQHYPGRLDEFTSALDVFRTPADFQAKKLENPLGKALFDKALDAARSIPPGKMNKKELLTFGRTILHDLPALVEIQEKLVEMVSEAVNEPVELSYNFLSLYLNVGILSPHLDAPTAKWTLDLCLEQSSPWPVYFSQVVPWPEVCQYSKHGWMDEIRKDKSLHFTPFTLEPGEAVIFSGSSQWHYREPIPQVQKENFCRLVFFHFIPKGSGHLIHPVNWASHFNMPELSVVVKNAAGDRLLQQPGHA